VLIAIEGIDGSGKGTQASLLQRQLLTKGHSTQLVRFPRYQDTFFGKEVGQYLNGEYGSLDRVPAKLSALLYALDRFESRKMIDEALNGGEVVICDRYIGSNMAHQGARVPPDQSQEVMNWIKKVELEVLGLPKPDIVFFMDMPVQTAQSLVGKKDPRSYTEKAFDLHEESSTHLARALENFRALAHAEAWVRIECADEFGLAYEPDAINRSVLKHLRSSNAA
jgi:dTMP kinase